MFTNLWDTAVIKAVLDVLSFNSGLLEIVAFTIQTIYIIEFSENWQ